MRTLWYYARLVSTIPPEIPNPTIQSNFTRRARTIRAGAFAHISRDQRWWCGVREKFAGLIEKAMGKRGKPIADLSF